MKCNFSNKSTWVGTLAVVVFAVTGCGGNLDYNEKAKTIGVKENMKTVQAAVEKYFSDHTYMYPTVIDDDFKSYFQGGDSVAKKPGKPPLNPFTGTEEWPVMGKITNLEEARKAAPDTLGKGVIEYSPLDGGKSYGIRAGAETGKAVSSDQNNVATLVLSRDTFNKSSSTPISSSPIAAPASSSAPPQPTTVPDDPTLKLHDANNPDPN